ncbi:MAG: VOC family protein [Beijerinckiaceae bacterium]
MYIIYKPFELNLGGLAERVFRPKATGLGAKGETSPMNTFWGTRVATFRDPFGLRLILNAPLA